MDQRHPPDRGYGYVAARRFKSQKGIHLFGKVRRTDWRPVRETEAAMEKDQNFRSKQSEDDYDSADEVGEVKGDIDVQREYLKKRFDLWPQGRPDCYSCSESDESDKHSHYDESDDEFFNPVKRKSPFGPKTGTDGLPDLGDLYSQ